MSSKRRKITHNSGAQPNKPAREEWEPAFTLTTRPSTTASKKKTPQKSQKSTNESSKTKETLFQEYESDFDERLNLQYAIDLDGNHDAWEQMKYYRGFQLSEDDTIDKIYKGECIAIRGDEEPSKRKKKKHNGTEEVEYAWWYAQVLECRAEDPQHVYARIVWLYRPEDLDTGPLPHHGERELIPSNDMQIINCSSVGMKVSVVKWDEKSPAQRDANGKLPMVWRQTIDVQGNGGVSPPLQTYCICNQPADPDQQLIHCSSCDRHLHYDCITKAAIDKAAELGQDPDLENSGVNPENNADPGIAIVKESTPVDAAVAGTTEAQHSSFSSRIYDTLLSPFKSTSREPSLNPPDHTTTASKLPNASQDKSILETIHDVAEDAISTPTEQTTRSATKRKRDEDLSPTKSNPRSISGTKRGRPSSKPTIGNTPVVAQTSTPKRTPKSSTTPKSKPPTKSAIKAIKAKLTATIEDLVNDPKIASHLTTETNGTIGKTDARKQVKVWKTSSDGPPSLFRVFDLSCLFDDCGKVIA